MNLQTLEGLHVAGKRVLVRADLNVPLDDGRVADDARIRAAAETIREIIERGGFPIITAHLGRPGGGRDPGLSLRSVLPSLSEAIDRPIKFIADLEEAAGAGGLGSRCERCGHTEQGTDDVVLLRAVVRNGPLGAAEVPGFEWATHRVAACIAERTRQDGLTSVAGGGDTGAALAEAGVRDDVTYVSLAGGAFLEWLEGKQLPGVAALVPNRSYASRGRGRRLRRPAIRGGNSWQRV